MRALSRTSQFFLALVTPFFLLGCQNGLWVFGGSDGADSQFSLEFKLQSGFIPASQPACFDARLVSLQASNAILEAVSGSSGISGEKVSATWESSEGTSLLKIAASDLDVAQAKLGITDADTALLVNDCGASAAKFVGAALLPAEGKRGAFADVGTAYLALASDEAALDKDTTALINVYRDTDWSETRNSEGLINLAKADPALAAVAQFFEYKRPIVSSSMVEGSVSFKAMRWKEGSGLAIESFSLASLEADGGPVSFGEGESAAFAARIAAAEAAGRKNAELKLVFPSTSASLRAADSGLSVSVGVPLAIAKAVAPVASANQKKRDHAALLARELALPGFDVPAGTYSAAQSVALTHAVAGVSFHYTTDGTTPTCASGVTYTSPIAVDASLSLKAIACRAEGKPSSVATASYVIDTLLPSVTLASAAPLVTNTSPFAISVTFSEDVTGFAQSDLSVTGGTVSNFSGSGSTYFFDFVPIGDGTKSISIAANAAADAAGNGNSAAATLARDYDASPPASPAVSGPAATTSGTPTWSWTSGGGGAGSFRYKLDDSDLTGGTTTASSMNFTPGSALPAGTHTLYVQEQDVAGNWSSAGAFSLSIDQTPPGISINSTAAFPTNASPAPITLTFSENVTGFTAGDISVSGGTLANFAGSGATYTFDFVLSGNGTKTVNIAAAVASDIAGNANTAATQFSFVYDTTIPSAPTVSATTPSNDSTPTWSWTSGGSGGNGTFRYKLDDSNLASGATTATAASFTPGSALSAGIHTLYVQERNAAGSWSASGSFAVTLDFTAPTVVISSGATSPTNTSPIPMAVTFSESVTGFADTDLNVSGGTVGGFVGSGTTYTFNFTPSGDGAKTVDVAADLASDAAGNNNTAATQFSITYDATPPSAPAVSATSPTNDTTPTWSWTAGTGGNGTFRYKLDDATLTSGATETASTSFTPGSALSAAAHTLYVQERDAAGNWSASGTYAVTIDTTVPTISYGSISPGASGTTQTPTVLGSASETSAVTLYSDAGCSAAISSAATHTAFNSPGITTSASLTLNTATNIYGKAVDTAGNESSCTSLVSYTPDGAPSAGGSGVITTSGVTAGAVTLSWTKATDAVSAQSALQYLVYYSTSNDIDTPANAVANGTAVGAYAADIAGLTVSGLANGTAYYFNVLVKDAVTNVIAYQTVSATTLSDSTAPVPGGSSALSASWNGASIALSWTAATDNVSAQSALQYKVVRADSGTLTDVTNAEAGTTVTNWTANLTSTTASGLTPGNTYFLNVIVKDEAGNKAIYSQASRVFGADELRKTAGSPERKTFFDSGSNKHWAFWYSGSSIRYGYSADGTSFTDAGSLAYNTPRFTVSAKGGSVLIALENGYDILVRRGSISATSITWESAVTPFDAIGASDAYSVPALAIGGDDAVYVAAAQHSGSAFVARAKTSTGNYSAALIFGAAASLGSAVGNVDGMALVPAGSYAMAITSSSGALQAFEYGGSSWTKKSGNVSAWSNLATREGSTGYLNALAMMGGELYVAGNFTNIGGLAASHLAKWNGSSWVAVGGLGYGSIDSLAVSASTLYAGHSSGISKWDGSSWSALGTGLNGQAKAIAVSGNDIYVGGSFTTAGGSSAAKIAKWDGSNWSALGSGLSGNVNAIAVAGSNVYAGGSFTTAGGSSANYVAKWDGTNWTALGSGLGGVVNAVAVSGNDVYVGGSFTTAGGSSANYVAKWDGTSWSALGSGVSAAVNALVASGSDLYVGGTHTTAGGSSANYVAKWNGSAWSALGSGVAGTVNAVLVSGTSLYAGGWFTSAGGSAANKIAKWNGSSWSAMTSGADLPSTISAVAVSGSDIYVGGMFGTIAGVSAYGIAKWNGSSWSALGSSVAGAVYAIAVSDSDVYVGGTFTTAGGSSANYVAKWNGSAWSALGTGLGGYVYALAASGSDLYVGGDFTTAGGSTANFIAKWNGTAWSALGSGVNATVRALAISGSNLYAGGDFTTADGSGANYIAKWSGSAWSALGSGLGALVRTIALSGNDMYVGGEFTTAGGSAAAYVAKWDGSAWSALGSGLGSSTYSLAISGSDLYAGGWFTQANGASTVAKYVAKWNGSTWSEVGTGQGDSVYALAMQNSTLVAGGSGALATYGSGYLESTSAFSATSDAEGVHLAVVRKADQKPYSISYLGKTWSGLTGLAATPARSQVTIGSSSYGGQRLVAWDSSGGGIAYRRYQSGAWSTQATLSSGYDNYFPIVALDLDAGTAPVVWTKGSDPYTLVGASAAFTGFDDTPASAPTVSGTASVSTRRPSWTWSSGGGGGTGTYRYRIDNSDWNTTTATGVTASADLSDGARVIYVQEKDAVGNWSASGTYTTTVDGRPSAPLFGTASTRFNSSFSATIQQWILPDADFYEFRYTVDGSTPTCLTATASSSQPTGVVIPAATTTLKAISCDATGNASPMNVAVYIYDNSAPTSPNVAVSLASTTSTTPTWTWTSGGGGNGRYRIKLDDATLTSGSTATTATSYTPGSGLSAGSHTLYVQERDDAGNWSNSGSAAVTITTPDTNAPTPGNAGALVVSDLTKTTAKISWSKASDDLSVQSALQYRVYTSASSNISTLNDVLANGAPAAAYATDSSSLSLSGLTLGTTYYVNVLTKDTSNNEAAYTETSFTTPSENPPVPGNSGLVKLSWNGSVMGVRWTVASDDVTAAASLEYKLVYDTGATLGTISGADAGTTATDWTANITSSTVTGLSAGTDYWFNVLVRDASGLKAIYGATTQKAEEQANLQTGDGSERKAFFDATSGKHWAFWYGGNSIRYGYSADGTTFTEAGSLAYNTPRFSVSGKDGTVLIAVENSYDILLRRGAISGTSITWEAAVTPFDASGTSDAYKRPALTIGEDDAVYIAAFQYGTGAFTPKAKVSTGDFTAALTFGAAATAGLISSSAESLAFVPQGSYAMLLSSTGGALQSYAYDGEGWKQKAGNATDWMALSGYAGAGARVNAVALSGSDVYIAGTFTAVGRINANYVAKWNGTSWSSLGSGVSATIEAIAVSGSDVYVGGQNYATGYIAKWNGSSWTALGSGVGGTVRAIAVSGSDLYVGGDFTTAGGSAANRVAKWNGSSWSALGSGVGNSVYALAVSGSNLYVGGTFTTAGGSGANYIARWDGSGWNALGSGVGSSVYALAASGSDLYVGGQFSTAGGAAATYLAKWNGSAWSTVGGGAGGTVRALAVSGSDLYVGGSFFSTNGGGTSASRVAKWDGTSWSALGNGASGTVYGLAASGTSLYIAGNFTQAGDIAATYVAKWDSSVWSSLGTGIDGIVNAVAIAGTDVYVAGSFTGINGIAATNVAKWNGSSWSALGSGVNSTVNAMVYSGGNLYLGGFFSTAGGSSANYIAKWNGSAWSALGSGLGSFVYSLAVSGSDVYAGGSFTTAGGSSANYIAKWNGSAWSALGSGVGSQVNAIVLSGSDVYVGGGFTTAGGAAASRVAKWNGTAWSAVGTSITSGTIYALGISGSDIYAGGSVQINVGGTTSSAYAARWDGTNWSPLGTDLIANNIYAIAVSGADVYAAGVESKVFKCDASSCVALGSGMGSSIQGLAISGSTFIATSYYTGVFSYVPTIAKSPGYSAASSRTAGVHLAYIDTNGIPNYTLFDGTSWSAASFFSSNAANNISLAVSPAADWALVAWERGGTIETRKYSLGAWGSVSTPSTGTQNRGPSLPMSIDNPVLPLMWNKGSEPATLSTNAFSFP